MLAVLLVIAVAIVAGIVVAVATRPTNFRIIRVATFSVPLSYAFEQVNDLHKWEAWSPWAKMDPSMKRTYEGPPAGTGAIHSWKGNSKVGEGRMTITESRPSELVRIKLEFLKPFKATNTAEFTFKPVGEQTEVTWSMSGTNNFFGKAFDLFMNMDKTVGADFERGLAAMKALLEAGSKPSSG
jgi:hypothetical protein